MTRQYAAMAAAVLMAGAMAAGQGAVGWRGDGTGQYPKATPVTEWSAQTNVVWKTALPAKSNATPVIVGEKIFVCAEPATLLCVNKANGNILWQKVCDRDSLLTPEEKAAEDKRIRERIASEEARVENAKKQFEAAPGDEKLKAELEKAKKQLEDAPRAEKLRTEIERREKALLHQMKEVAKEPSATPPPASQVNGEETAAQRLADAARLPPATPPATHETNGYTSATPVSDGKSVYVVFGTGIVACYDLEGNRTWARLVERPSHGWGHSSSPVLVGDTLIVHVQKVWGLKASDGQTAWTADSAQAWGTPAGARVGGTAVVITPAGDLIRADNGGKIASKLGGLTYASPLVHDGLVYFLQDKACCVRLPEKAEPVAQLTAVWANAGRQKRYYASSVLHEGRLYMVNQAGDFNVLDAASGATLSGRKLDLGGTTYPSIALAGGHIFVSSDSGVTIVLTPGNDAPQVARNTLEPFRSTPVFEGARMYVRAMENLYCIGK